MASGIKLKFDIEDDIINFLNAAQDRKLYYRHHAHEEQESLPNFELFL
jgi:hypothetical protein